MSDCEEEIYETIACLDIYAHASRIGECFSNSLSEAMAAGIPTVTLSTPNHKLTNGQTFQVDNGVTGFVANTADTYVEAVARLAGDPDLRRQMGMAGRTKLETEYSPKALTRRLEQLIVLALKRRGNILSTNEETLIEAETPVFTTDRYTATIREVIKRENAVFGPPTLWQLLREIARVPKRLWQRWLDKQEMSRRQPS
jgi:hypothetical protein